VLSKLGNYPVYSIFSGLFGSLFPSYRINNHGAPLFGKQAQDFLPFSFFTKKERKEDPKKECFNV